MFLGDAPHVAALHQAAEWQERARQAFLGERVEHVALILGGVHAAAQGPGAAWVLGYPRVVAGGDGVEPVLERVVEEGAELEVAVAVDARVGCPSVLVGLHELIDHVALEELAHVEYVMGDAQTLADGLGIGDVGE